MTLIFVFGWLIDSERIGIQLCPASTATPTKMSVIPLHCVEVIGSRKKTRAKSTVTAANPEEQTAALKG